MLGITYQNITKINELGYRIIESNNLTAQIIEEKTGEAVATISVNKKGYLTISIGGKRVKNLKWIVIHGLSLPEGIAIELQKKNGSKFWSELPVKGGMCGQWS